MFPDFPEKFVDSLRLIKDLDKEELLSALNKESITSVRKNPHKNCNLKLGEKIPWCENGYYLEDRPKFTLDPHFHAGAYYVQESSSMYIEYLLSKIDKSRINTVLDFCAAPGGKTSHLMTLFPEALVFANEVNKKRYQILKENLIKHGGGNALLSSKYANQFTDVNALFDLIVIDAPCSGEGMFRKDHNARDEWSLNNVATCVERQEEIVDVLSDKVSKDGYLVYSTCTFNLQENDEIVNRIISNGFELIYVSPIEGVEQRSIETGSVNAFYPGKVRGEGLFMALLKRVKESASGRIKNKLKKLDTVNFQSFLSKEYIAYSILGKEFILRSDLWMKTNNVDLSFVYESVLKSGEIKGKNYIPDHSIALSIDFRKEEVIELEKDQALDFLRAKEIKPISNSKGFVPVSFEGNVLGWIKVISPTRVNNYYPKEYRIRNL